MKNLKILSANVDHHKDFVKRKIKIKTNFSKKNHDFYMLQEIFSINDVKYITPDNYFYLPPSPYGNTIISKVKSEKYFTVDLKGVDAICGFYNFDCHRYLLISTHFTWGTAKESERIENAYKLEQAIRDIVPFDANKDKNEIYTILAGDLNATPDSQTIRYLIGKECYNNSATQYTDPFEKSKGYNYTSSYKNKYFIRTAKENLFNLPKYIPERRIDYILLRGFAHGRVGAALSTKVHTNNDYLFSDHYPISVKIFC